MIYYSFRTWFPSLHHRRCCRCFFLFPIFRIYLVNIFLVCYLFSLISICSALATLLKKKKRECAFLLPSFPSALSPITAGILPHLKFNTVLTHWLLFASAVVWGFHSTFPLPASCVNPESQSQETLVSGTELVYYLKLRESVILPILICERSCLHVYDHAYVC